MMTLLQLPRAAAVRAQARTLPPLRPLDAPAASAIEGRLNPECSVPAFRSFAVGSHVHADEINAEEAVRLMLAFYEHVHAPEGLLAEDGDVLQVEWGMYDCGETELFHFELSREFTEAGKADENRVSRFTLGLHYRPTFTLRALAAGNRWCWSPADIEAFKSEIRLSEVYRAVATLQPAEVALEWSPM
jgi:hypothetical protein